jgi:cytochrome P450
MSAAPSPASSSPFFTEAFPLDPHPAIARLREEDPVHFVPGLDFWFVTRHEDVKRLFHDPENVTPDRRVWERYVPPPEGSFMRWVSDHGLFSLPPAEHARVRKLVSAAFTPRAVARMEDQVREVVGRFAGPLRGRTGVVDLMAEYTEPIPNAVISRITGVPPAGDDEVRFRELAQATIRGFFAFGDPALQRQGEDAFVELAAWVRALAKERRDAPRDDLVTDLVQARDRDDRMSDDEIVVLITGLIGAGSETTAIGGMIALLTLLEHPDALEHLRADRALLPGAVNEILRFGFGGAGGLPRYAVRDFTLRGKEIHRGQMLMLSFAGAHRDPRVFPDPDRFDVERDTRDLVVFGNGPHHCLGAHLARAEMRCMIDAALDFLPPEAHFRADLLRRAQSGFFRRPENLPVDFRGAN